MYSSLLITDEFKANNVDITKYHGFRKHLCIPKFFNIDRKIHLRLQRMPTTALL